MRAVDTNVLVRMITGDNARQTGVADQFIEKGAWVSILAIAEVTWVLDSSYKQSALEIASAVEIWPTMNIWFYRIRTSCRRHWNYSGRVQRWVFPTACCFTSLVKPGICRWGRSTVL